MRVLATLAACVLFAAPAAAQQCPSMADFLTLLAEDYGEVPVASGTAGAQAPMPVMIFANTATGTWTFVAVIGGCARAMASGERWTMSVPEPTVPGEDT
jgi:hypothetical protein